MSNKPVRGAAFNAIMEEETQESLADLYLAALAENAELTQKLADNDLAFEHAQEVILAHEQENAELKRKLESVEFSIYYRLNEYLCDMKPEQDDSIVGFNDAWDVVRKVFAKANLPVSDELILANRALEQKLADTEKMRDRYFVEAENEIGRCARIERANRALELQVKAFRDQLREAGNQSTSMGMRDLIDRLLARTDAYWREMAEEESKNG